MSLFSSSCAQWLACINILLKTLTKSSQQNANAATIKECLYWNNIWKCSCFCYNDKMFLVLKSRSRMINCRSVNRLPIVWRAPPICQAYIGCSGWAAGGCVADDCVFCGWVLFACCWCCGRGALVLRMQWILHLSPECGGCGWCG